MAFLNEVFNINDLPSSDRDYELVPAGWYSVTINSAELKPTKAGTGTYINIRYDITGPSHQGRIVWGKINIRNKNPDAERIGRQQLGELMRAIGIAQIQDTDQLVGADLSVKVKISPARDGYEASNDVSGFKPSGGAPRKPSVAQTQAQTQAQPGPKPAAAPPWARK